MQTPTQTSAWTLMNGIIRRTSLHLHVCESPQHCRYSTCNSTSGCLYATWKCQEFYLFNNLFFVNALKQRHSAFKASVSRDGGYLRFASAVQYLGTRSQSSSALTSYFILSNQTTGHKQDLIESINRTIKWEFSSPLKFDSHIHREQSWGSVSYLCFPFM